MRQLDSESVNPYHFRVARGKDKADALSMRRAVYEKDRGFAPVDGLDDLGFHLVAKNVHGEVIACSRLVSAEYRPFDVEQFISLAEVLPGSSVPAEVGRLCVRPDHRTISRHPSLQFGMFKLTCLLGIRLGVTDFIMYTFADLVNFYRSARFVMAGVDFEHPGYCQVMHVMRLNLAQLRVEQTRFAEFLFTPDLEHYEL